MQEQISQTQQLIEDYFETEIYKLFDKYICTYEVAFDPIYSKLKIGSYSHYMQLHIIFRPVTDVTGKYVVPGDILYVPNNLHLTRQYLDISDPNFPCKLKAFKLDRCWEV